MDISSANHSFVDSSDEEVETIGQPVEADAPDADEIVDLTLSVLSDGLDHPEIWAAVPEFLVALPNLPSVLEERLGFASGDERVSLLLLLGMCGAAFGQASTMLEQLEPLSAQHSQSPLNQQERHR